MLLVVLESYFDFTTQICAKPLKFCDVVTSRIHILKHALNRRQSRPRYNNISLLLRVQTPCYKRFQICELLVAVMRDFFFPRLIIIEKSQLNALRKFSISIEVFV